MKNLSRVIMQHDQPLILRRCHGTTSILVITADIAPQPKLIINVPHSGILSKPSTTMSTNNYVHTVNLLFPEFAAAITKTLQQHITYDFNDARCNIMCNIT